MRVPRVRVRRTASLRARLVIGLIALAALGLAAADVVTYTSLRSFLVDRVDGTLEATHAGVEPLVFGRDGGGAGPGPGPVGGLEPGSYVELLTADGKVVRATGVPSVPGGPTPPPPRLPGRLDIPAAGAGDGDRVRYLTVPAEQGGGRYRVRASIERQAPGFVLVIAQSLAGVDSTLHRLLLIEAIVTGAVLAAMIALGLWVIRLGLRPLVAIEQTADRIAGGDLSQRVKRADERTEVGRLGLALNAMLAQIESAFRAREASEQKLRRFVADASHELRTPLAAVRAYAELFERGASTRPDDLSRSMSGISRESERMSVLVDDLLLLARLDEGRPLEREPVDLETVVGEAVETAQTVEPDRPIELDARPASVVGDRVRLRQIVDNLLANVRAHTPAATPVQVAVGPSDGRAVIEIRDSGPGLDAEQAERVFERFYRADPSRARASGGVGLGLAIVAAVAEAHGGDVAVSSRPGEGATFRISLPLRAPGSNGAGA